MQCAIISQTKQKGGLGEEVNSAIHDMVLYLLREARERLEKAVRDVPFRSSGRPRASDDGGDVMMCIRGADGNPSVAAVLVGGQSSAPDRQTGAAGTVCDS
ncbi:hypothetical protein PIB30_078995 [Stylosanthes scabra]|uniref:Uncharacterized protein n=1 Tax=Stylosanthes scabra TaxID=79078 RepID=A0ABU6TQK5_9FABA|nr:hypothetical protein [Stylosanthes scabra]